MDTKHSGDVSDTLFKVYCPGQYKTFPHKLKMYNNGSVNNNIEYKDICNIDNFNVNVVYEPYPGFLEIVNDSMVEYYDFWNLITDFSMIVYDFEILKPFFKNNNIIVNWTASSNYSVFVRQVNNN